MVPVTYYRGSSLARRLKEREKEMEADARDRAREKEELDEIRRQLLEEGHPDPEAEMAKVISWVDRQSTQKPGYSIKIHEQLLN